MTTPRTDEAGAPPPPATDEPQAGTSTPPAEAPQPPLGQAAAAGPPAPPPQATDMSIEVVVETAEGFHVRYSGRVAPKDVPTYIKNLAASLKLHGFLPVDSRTQVNMEIPVPVAGGGGAGATGKKYTGKVFEECPECDGPIYDNREKKESPGGNPAAPWFKCKNEDCGWAKWPGKPKKGSS